jgi:hypothetical protein
MGRQLRTLPSMQGNLPVTITRGSSTVATIANYGVTELTTDLAVDFTLAAPETGCEKIVYCRQATTGVLLRANPKGTSAVMYDTTGNAFIEFDGAGTKVVRMVGINSTQWLITSIAPVSTALNVAASS